MKLTDQVISLELAKRLKALGVKQEAHFKWSEPDQTEAQSKADKLGLSQANVQLTTVKWGSMFNQYAAFTVAELGEMLPFAVKVDGEYVSIEGYKNTDETGWEAWFADNGGTMVRNKISAPTEAEARGLMLAYLIENGLYSTK